MKGVCVVGPRLDGFRRSSPRHWRHGLGRLLWHHWLDRILWRPGLGRILDKSVEANQPLVVLFQKAAIVNDLGWSPLWLGSRRHDRVIANNARHCHLLEF